MLPDEVEAYMKSPTPTHPACVVTPFRRRGEARPIPQQTFVRNHADRIREERRARWLRDLRRLGLAFLLLGVGLAIAWWRN